MPKFSLQLLHSLAGVMLLFALVGCSDSTGDSNGNGESDSSADRVEITAADKESETQLKKQIELLRPLHTPMGKPKPGEWLAQHKEAGQSFELYVASKPVRPLGKRRTIYIQPLGEFTATQKKIVGTTAEFMGLYFNTPVKVNETVPLSAIPAEAMRTHPSWGDRQILSTYVLYDLLKPKLPDDAACFIAFTAHDLWPGEGWNFVFGQASLRERVGVWSMYRFGDPDADKAGFDRSLMRTLQTAVHETGHMFSISHCTAFECNMCGSNSLPESDRRDVWMCPLCVAKVCWSARVDMIDRYKALKAFYDKHGFEKESKFMQRSIVVLVPKSRSDHSAK